MTTTYQTRQRLADAPGFFWTPPDEIQNGCVRLFGDEARHARTVCRVTAGEMITVCDGAGNAYDCEVESSGTRELFARVIRQHRALGEPIAQVTLAAGVGRPAVFDWIVEKAVELGAVRIIPLRAHHSPSSLGGHDAAKRRVTRWRRLSLAAMKQSLRTVWPPIEDMQTPDELATTLGQYHWVWLGDPEGGSITGTDDRPPGRRQVLLIVGPESGFTADERRVFIDAGARAMSLGERRLRAETAALAALTLVMHRLGDI